MNMNIKPYEGIDKLVFGMSRQEVGHIVGEGVNPFIKQSSTGTATEVFIEKGIHIHYDFDNRCEAIEFAAPSGPIFQGIQFIGIPFIELKEKFILIDNKLEIDETGFTSFKYGIGVYVSSLKESESEPIEGVIIFKKGYYD